MIRRAIAAAAGVALFAPWFDAGPTGWVFLGPDAFEPLGGGRTLTAWQAFSSLDILLALLALAMLTRLARFAAPLALAIVAAILIDPSPTVVGHRRLARTGGGGRRRGRELRARAPAPPRAPAARGACRRTRWPAPGGRAVRAGVWLALAGSVLAWAGSWLSMRDDTTPGAVAPDLPPRPAPA